MVSEAEPLLRATVESKLWLSVRKATEPVGVAFPEGPATVAVKVVLWLGVGARLLVLSLTVGVSLPAIAITDAPLAEEPSQLPSPE